MYRLMYDVGATIRWILKGFKTNYKDEINSNNKGIFLINYPSLECWILGFIFYICFLLLCFLLFVWEY